MFSMRVEPTFELKLVYKPDPSLITDHCVTIMYHIVSVELNFIWADLPH